MATSAHIVPISASGDFQRPTSTFRDWISKEPGSEFPPEVGRYHIYISHACPWAHRTMIVRQLKGLEDIISVTSVHHHGGTSDTGNHISFSTMPKALGSKVDVDWKFEFALTVQ
jgi:glutathionyl-hydroquinone reductase